MEIGKTASGPDGVLHHAPEAFDRIEMVATMGGEEMEAKLIAVVVEGRVEFMCSMDPAAIDDHHHLFADFAARRHDLMHVLAQLLGIKMGHDFIEDLRGPIL